MVKLSNDENIKNLKIREKLRIAIIISSLITIVLATLNLFCNLSLVFALLFAIVTFVLQKKRDSIVIRKSDELLRLEKAKKERKRMKRK